MNENITPVILKIREGAPLSELDWITVIGSPILRDMIMHYDQHRWAKFAPFDELPMSVSVELVQDRSLEWAWVLRADIPSFAGISGWMRRRNLSFYASPLSLHTEHPFNDYSRVMRASTDLLDVVKNAEQIFENFITDLECERKKIRSILGLGRSLVVRCSSDWWVQRGMTAAEAESDDDTRRIIQEHLRCVENHALACLDRLDQIKNRRD